MERQNPSQTLSLQDSVQGELFPPEVLQRSGKPIRILVPDPNYPSRVKCLVAASNVMRELVSRVCQAAATNAIMLLLGESGTGKNLLAWLAHQLSSRRHHPFVHFSAGLKSEQLMEGELFGHEKGAFTGAHEARRGKIESAQGGTIFIDEIAELGASGQLKFHRLLDDGTFERLGGTEERRADVRVIAATHRDLGSLAREGKFRDDLYHRINVVCLNIPPLRERPEDIAPIAQELLEDLASRHGKPELRWSPETLEFLSKLPWVGNIRAVRNVIERMVVFAKGDVLRLDGLPSELFFSSSPTEQHLKKHPQEDSTKHSFQQAFKSCRGNKSALARLLRTSRSQVDRLIARFGKPE